MSKVIQSPVKRWPGMVTLHDPLSYPQLIAWEDAINAADKSELADEARAKNPDGKLTLGAIGARPRLAQTVLPGILACVEKWELQSFPEIVTLDTFPSTPRMPALMLISWLMAEINKLYDDAGEVPNE